MRVWVLVSQPGNGNETPFVAGAYTTEALAIAAAEANMERRIVPITEHGALLDAGADLSRLAFRHDDNAGLDITYADNDGWIYGRIQPVDVVGE